MDPDGCLSLIRGPRGYTRYIYPQGVTGGGVAASKRRTEIVATASRSSSHPYLTFLSQQGGRRARLEIARDKTSCRRQ